MKFEEIEEYMTGYPVYQYVFLESTEIEFSDRVRTICRQECPRFGRSWSCPPAVGSVEECRMRCQAFPNVLLFSTVAEVTDWTSMEESLKTKRDHEKVTGAIESFIRENGVPCLTLSSDSCARCDTCSYPDHPCVHPQQMHPCIESHGIVLTNTIEENQMDYFLGETLILWFTLIFLDAGEQN